MKVHISFRRAVVDDIEFLLALRQQTMHEHLVQAEVNMSVEQHMARIKEFFDESHIILANSEAIGLLKLGLLADRLHIRQFQIAPKYQGQGIGSFVLKIAKKRADKLKLPITLNVLLNNPVKALYLRHGFKIEGKNTLEYHMRSPFVAADNN